MVPSLCLSSIQDTLYPFCFGIYILGNLLKHVNSAHPLAILVPQANQVVFFLHVSSPFVLLLGSILFAS
jgi:hypothetical protein